MRNCYFLKNPDLGPTQSSSSSLCFPSSVFENLGVFLLLLFLHLVLCFWTCGCVFFSENWVWEVGSWRSMRSSVMNLTTAVIGFGMSATFIVFVCTRIICGRLRRAESRPMFEIESRIDLEQVLFNSLYAGFFFFHVLAGNW